MQSQRQRVFRLVQLLLIILVAAGPLGLAAARSDRQPSRLLQSTVTPSGPSSTPTLDSDQPVIYVVQAGDTLTQIANQFGLALAQLLKLNQLQNDAVIVVGQKLIVGSAPATPLPSPTGLAAIETTPDETASATPPPLPTDAATSTAEATATPPPSPTPGTDSETLTPTPLPRPTAAAAPTPPDTGLPLDVIVVLVVMALAVIGLVIGLRMQRG